MDDVGLLLVGILLGAVLASVVWWGHAIHQEADDYAEYLDSLKKMHGPYDHRKDPRSSL